MSIKARAYIYRTLTALAPIAVAYGLLTDAEVVLWITAVGTLLGFGMAAINTDPKTADYDFGEIQTADFGIEDAVAKALTNHRFITNPDGSLRLAPHSQVDQ